MDHTAKIQQIFRQLAEPNRGDEIESATRRVMDILKQPGIDEEAILSVLQSEQSQSYFQPGHLKQNASIKCRFDFVNSEAMCQILAEAFPTATFKGPSLFDSMSADSEQHTNDHLRQHGYCVMPLRLDEQICESIISSLGSIPFRVKATSDAVNGYHPDQAENINGNTAWVASQQSILAIPEVQQLASDPMILNLVQDYLGCTPIHDQANCWWSIGHRTNARTMKSDAQLFHQDKDFVRFVKAFIYLRDVTEENGPHTYISGSARDYDQHVPSNYRMNQRLEDDYLSSQYDQDRFVTFTGQQGTVILEDTSGFHKGTPVLKGHRLMLQLEYCGSLFGGPGPCFALEGLQENYVQLAAKHPRLYSAYDDTRYQEYSAQRARNQVTKRRRLKKAVRVVQDSIIQMSRAVGIRKAA